MFAIVSTPEHWARVICQSTLASHTITRDQGHRSKYAITTAPWARYKGWWLRFAIVSTPEHMARVKCLHKTALYLIEMCIPVSTIQGRSHFRSAVHGELVVPRSTRVTFGNRSISVSGSETWRSLPLNARDFALSFEQFTSLLKTVLFNIAYMHVMSWTLSACVTDTFKFEREYQISLLYFYFTMSLHCMKLTGLLRTMLTGGGSMPDMMTSRILALIFMILSLKNSANPLQMFCFQLHSFLQCIHPYGWPSTDLGNHLRFWPTSWWYASTTPWRSGWY